MDVVDVMQNAAKLFFALIGLAALGGGSYLYWLHNSKFKGM